MTLDGVSISNEPSIFQRGKGIIVDSGTTDTYLPKFVAKGFSKAWEAATGSVRVSASIGVSAKGGGLCRSISKHVPSITNFQCLRPQDEKHGNKKRQGAACIRNSCGYACMFLRWIL